MHSWMKSAQNLKTDYQDKTPVMVTLYGISNCDTIKKVKKLFDQHGLEYEFHDYRKSGCSPQLIKTFYQHFTYTELVNTRGTTWRKLPEEQRNKIDAAAAIQLMCENPALIKRPVINFAGHWVLGYDQAQLNSLIKQH